MSHHLTGSDVWIIAIIVLYVGQKINDHWRFLKENSIPAAVTGGLVCSMIIAVMAAMFDYTITFDMAVRDKLLLAFFSTIGLGARFAMLRSGGKALILMTAVAVVFLIVQNSTGVALTYLFDAHPGYGLMAGSIAFAGGHGTAIAWGQEADAAGLIGAAEFGIACATFGLIAGGLLGGPLAGRLIRRHNLQPDSDAALVDQDAAVPAEVEAEGTCNYFWAILGTLLAIAVCVSVGDVVNRLFAAQNLKVPGFLTAMLVGIILINASDVMKIGLSRKTVDMTGEISLQLFLSMSLMSMSLLTLASAAQALLVVVLVQMLIISLFVVFVVFRLLGRTYDAAVMAAGFLGLGLGATPVAIANMSAVTEKYGPSPKAFIIIPLVGAFFIDLANAMIIKLFLGFDFMHQPIPTNIVP